MQKIMFDDKFGLTEAVLDGRKTMTRRVISAKAIEYILGEFKQKYFEETLDVFDSDKKYIEQYYLVEKCGKCFRPGDIVAVAQKYKDIMPYLVDSFRQPSPDYMMDKPGYNNKMYVRADLMPHQIRITNIRIERIQNISNEECLREGVQEAGHHSYYVHGQNDILGLSAKDVFSILIEKISGKGTWESNPWVFVYEFELEK